jgi:hypothetical protein
MGVREPQSLVKAKLKVGVSVFFRGIFHSFIVRGKGCGFSTHLLAVQVSKCCASFNGGLKPAAVVL